MAIWDEFLNIINQLWDKYGKKNTVTIKILTKNDHTDHLKITTKAIDQLEPRLHTSI